MGVTIKMGANTSFDMTNYDFDTSYLGDVSISSYNSSAITGYVGDVKVVIKGKGFTYSDSGVTGGTVTGFVENDGGSFYASVSGLKLSVKTIANLAENGTVGDIHAFVRNTLSGDDAITGSGLTDVLFGYDGKDQLFGKAGSDTIYGGKGDDRITGGIGADSLFGGAGKDSFIYTTASESGDRLGIDTIFDFSGKSGDRINLSAIDANTRTAKNDAFAFVGSKAFSGTAGELRVEKTAADTTVYADTNGDKIADFTLHFDDPLTLSKGFFVL